MKVNSELLTKSDESDGTVIQINPMSPETPFEQQSDNIQRNIGIQSLKKKSSIIFLVVTGFVVLLQMTSLFLNIDTENELISTSLGLKNDTDI